MVYALVISFMQACSIITNTLLGTDLGPPLLNCNSWSTEDQTSLPDSTGSSHTYQCLTSTCNIILHKDQSLHSDRIVHTCILEECPITTCNYAHHMAVQWPLTLHVHYQTSYEDSSPIVSHIAQHTSIVINICDVPHNNNCDVPDMV